MIAKPSTIEKAIAANQRNIRDLCNVPNRLEIGMRRRECIEQNVLIDEKLRRLLLKARSNLQYEYAIAQPPDQIVVIPAPPLNTQ